MIPEWLNDTVRSFGHQLGLRSFELNDRGAAAVRFENGNSIRFEYANDSLLISAGVPMSATEENIKSLLTAVHPAARHVTRLRAAYLERAGEAVYVARIPERDVNVTGIETVFRELFGAADRLRRAAS